LAPIGEKIVFFLVSIEEKFVFFGRDRLFYIMLFNVMISRFFPVFSPKNSGNGKTGKKKRENGKTGNGDDLDTHTDVRNGRL
jgi:hypothetical protein